MSLQDTFYLITIIMETLAIILLAALVVFVFFMMKKFGQLSDNINRKIDAAGKIVEDPADVAFDVGAAIAVSSFHKVKKLLKKK
jgi:uncharacterized membrane protein